VTLICFKSNPSLKILCLNLCSFCGCSCYRKVSIPLENDMLIVAASLLRALVKVSSMFWLNSGKYIKLFLYDYD